MIVFVSRSDDDIKVQNLIDETFNEAMFEIDDVNEFQIFHTMLVRDISDRKSFS